MVANVLGALVESQDWSSFKESVNKLTDLEKGQAFEMLVKHYLKTDPIYATKLKEVWLLAEVPTKVRESLSLPPADQGIDIIARTSEGEYWAVQCKYRDDETKALTWREISTFAGLAFGVCRNISFGLVCTTGERLPTLLKNQSNIGLCTNEVWSNLSQYVFTSLAKNKTLPPPIPYVPRPHQQEAITNSVEYFELEGNSRGKMIMPCGTGKSLTAFWIAQALAAKTILVAVPSLPLLRQTLKVWAREGWARDRTKKYEWICVCSDDTVSKFGGDEAITLPQDLGVPCVTDEAAISDWFKKSRNADIRVVFTTYQSGVLTARASRQAGITYDFAIFDEAHKTAGRADGLFAHMLYDKHIDIKRRMFMTATERRYAGNSEQIVSMDNVQLYGDTFAYLSFKDALSHIPRIISDYRILTLIISKREVAELVAKNKFVRPARGRWDDEIEAEMLAALVALKKAMTSYPIKHVVSFHSTVSRAKAFSSNAELYTNLFPEHGELATFHVAGDQPTSVRERILGEFVRGKRSLISNARCLTEGIDLPRIDCVIFADPKKSNVDIVQALGRALRPAAGKEHGYIVVPVIYDDTKGTEAVWGSESFTDLVALLRALASSDERVVEYFRAVYRGEKRGSFRLHEHMASVRLSSSIDLKEFAEAIDLQCWDSLAKLSYNGFATAKRFVKRLGLHNETEWQEYCNGRLFRKPIKPPSIPEHPEDVYKEDWKGWDDWLGHSPAGGVYYKFEYAREIAQTLGLHSKKEWRAYISSHRDDTNIKLIHPNPDIIYYKDWQGWEDWLRPQNYWPFRVARAFSQHLKLNSRQDWDAFWSFGKLFGQKPSTLPIKPDLVYKKDWKGWEDWLGATRRPDGYWSFKVAREFVQQMNFKSRRHWDSYWASKVNLANKPPTLPVNPEQIYQQDWQGWSHWLGVYNPQSGKTNYRSFIKAREFVHGLRLANVAAWNSYCKGLLEPYYPKPIDVPANPDKVYESEWLSWEDWLGKVQRPNYELSFKLTSDEKAVLEGYSPFMEARMTVRALRIKNHTDWVKYTQGKLPGYTRRAVNIPPNPEEVYADSWKGWEDWLNSSSEPTDDK